MATTALRWETAVWSVVYYFLTGLGITAGYHRLFSHRAYKAKFPTRFALLMLGSGAVEGSCRWWCRDHRAHHRYVDTAKDPYSASHGFWHSHIGWMLVKQEPGRIGRADIRDLNEEPIMRWQHKWYIPIALFMGFLFPCLVAGLLWGDFRGGFFFSGVARLIFVHHSTFFVNSLAHYLGDAAFSDGHTAKNSVITALLTIGEGYHNFHHEFPSDYRNGVRWWQYDPTKWLIKALSWVGQTYELQYFPRNEILKGKLQMAQKSLDNKKRELNWGPDPQSLPLYTMEEVGEQCKLGESWVVLNGFVVDVKEFMEIHPGGKGYIASSIGKDVTEDFNGGKYRHSNAGHNLASTLRVGRIKP
jgi:stearoyl-CoA desaturase (delta-9 desaturase)